MVSASRSAWAAPGHRPARRSGGHEHVGRHAALRLGAGEPRADLIALEMRLVEVPRDDRVLGMRCAARGEQWLCRDVRLDAEQHGVRGTRASHSGRCQN